MFELKEFTMSETEYLSDSSCSSYGSELEEELDESFSTSSLEPYRFEPTKVSSSATNSVEETNEEKEKIILNAVNRLQRIAVVP